VGAIEAGMLTKPSVRVLAGTEPGTLERAPWYRDEATWRLVAEMLYVPIMAIAAYVLVWSLSRGAFSTFLQALGSPP
jgi:hypothetical protein